MAVPRTRKAPIPTLPRLRGMGRAGASNPLTCKRGREGPTAQPWEGEGFAPYLSEGGL